MTGTRSSTLAFAAIATAIATTTFSINAFADEVLAENTPPIAEARPMMLPQTTADVLKREYLKCDRAAAEGRLDMLSAVRCSLLYEELRDRVFDGDFDALLAWWRETR